MFVEEARLAARLSHANVVQVFEFDQIDGRHYLAMELVRGRHLGQVVERAREVGLRFGLPRTVHVIAEAAKALAYVHRAGDAGRSLGLVHRDVSPHNLLLSFEGEVKLADFGIARAMSLAGLTDPGTLKGKIAYMAPEQAGGGPVDARADVFSLGVVLWELCAGRRLFARDSEAATLAAVLGGPPPSPPSGWNEAVSPELDAVVLSALERNPAHRTSSAEEMEHTLSALLHRIAESPQDWDLRSFMHRLWPEGAASSPSVRVEATRVRPAQEPTAPAVPPPAEASGPDATSATRTLASSRRGRRRLWSAATAGLIVVAVAGGTGIRWWRAESPQAAADRAASSPAPAAAPTAPTPAFPTPAAVAPPLPQPTEAAHLPAPEPAAPAGSAEALRDAGAPRMGTLYVNATPWAQILVDGRAAGETPRELALPAGRHRVRVVHPSFGSSETTVEIRAGRRSSWNPNLQRR
jgi:serine/threonine-protein kinase